MSSPAIEEVILLAAVHVVDCRLQGIQAINTGIQEVAKATKQTKYLNCGAAYLGGGSLLTGGSIEKGLMPDALHPGAEGERSAFKAHAC